MKGGEFSPVCRPECADDTEFLVVLFAETHPLPGVDPRLADMLLRQQRTGQQAAYFAAYPDARFDVIEVGGERVGRIVLDEGRAGWSLLDIALLPAWRGRGLGTRLLLDVMAGARTADAPLRLRVGTGNAGARRLYEKLGFVDTMDGDAMFMAMVWPTPSPRAQPAVDVAPSS